MQLFYQIIVFIGDLREYWARNLPDVTKQCNKDNLIASLLFKDNEFPRKIQFEPQITPKSSSIEKSSEKLDLQLTTNAQSLELAQETPSKKDELLIEIQTEKDKIFAFQEEINLAVKKLQEVIFKLLKNTFLLLLIFL